jgi:hypothetical protein
MPTLHKNKKGNLAEETGTGQEGGGETETDMSGHEETRKKQKSQTPNRNSISHRRTGYRPERPQAEWPQAGWPQAGWPQARGHRPNFL